MDRMGIRERVSVNSIKEFNSKGIGLLFSGFLFLIMIYLYSTSSLHPDILENKKVLMDNLGDPCFTDFNYSRTGTGNLNYKSYEYARDTGYSSYNWQGGEDNYYTMADWSTKIVKTWLYNTQNPWDNTLEDVQTCAEGMNETNYSINILSHECSEDTVEGNLTCACNFVYENVVHKWGNTFSSLGNNVTIIGGGDGYCTVQPGAMGQLVTKGGWADGYTEEVVSSDVVGNHRTIEVNVSGKYYWFDPDGGLCNVTNSSGQLQSRAALEADPTIMLSDYIRDHGVYEIHWLAMYNDTIGGFKYASYMNDSGDYYYPQPLHDNITLTVNTSNRLVGEVLNEPTRVGFGSTMVYDFIIGTGSDVTQTYGDYNTYERPYGLHVTSMDESRCVYNSTSLTADLGDPAAGETYYLQVLPHPQDVDPTGKGYFYSDIVSVKYKQEVFSDVVFDSIG